MDSLKYLSINRTEAVCLFIFSHRKTFKGKLAAGSDCFFFFLTIFDLNLKSHMAHKGATMNA